MDNDLLLIVKELRNATTIEEVEKVKQLGESFLRKQKRMALLTLLSISEEMGEEEILTSIRELTRYLETALQRPK